MIPRHSHVAVLASCENLRHARVVPVEPQRATALDGGLPEFCPIRRQERNMCDLNHLQVTKGRRNHEESCEKRLAIRSSCGWREFRFRYLLPFPLSPVKT